MRIIHFSCVAPPEIGGIGRAAAAEVASLAERGHDAHLVSLTTHAGFRIGNVGMVHAVRHFIGSADIVHLHYPFYGTAGTLARLRRQGAIKRLVMTLHMDAMAPGWRGLAAALHRRFSQPSILQSADALIISSRDYARHSSYAGIAERAVELPFGVDETKFTPGKVSARGTPTVVFVGGMDRPHSFKGIPVLLDALSRLKDIQLVLVGDGNMRGSYEQQAEKLGVAERCRFVGKLSEQDLLQAYHSADLLVLPSTSGAEAFGLVALEAQSCGLPVIASDLPGVRTVVADGETGLLVPPNDPAALAQAISRLTSHDMLRAAFGVNARTRVIEKFTWKKHMDILTDLYHTLCELPS